MMDTARWRVLAKRMEALLMTIEALTKNMVEKASELVVVEEEEHQHHQHHQQKQHRERSEDGEGHEEEAASTSHPPKAAIARIHAYLKDMQVPLTEGVRNPLSLLHRLPHLGLFLDSCLSLVNSCQASLHRSLQPPGAADRGALLLAGPIALLQLEALKCIAIFGGLQLAGLTSAPEYSRQQMNLQAVSTRAHALEDERSSNEEQLAVRVWCKELLMKHGYATLLGEAPHELKEASKRALAAIQEQSSGSSIDALRLQRLFSQSSHATAETTMSDALFSLPWFRPDHSPLLGSTAARTSSSPVNRSLSPLHRSPSLARARAQAASWRLFQHRLRRERRDAYARATKLSAANMNAVRSEKRNKGPATNPCTDAHGSRAPTCQFCRIEDYTLASLPRLGLNRESTILLGLAAKADALAGSISRWHRLRKKLCPSRDMIVNSQQSIVRSSSCKRDCASIKSPSSHLGCRHESGAKCAGILPPLKNPHLRSTPAETLAMLAMSTVSHPDKETGPGRGPQPMKPATPRKPASSDEIRIAPSEFNPVWTAVENLYGQGFERCQTVVGLAVFLEAASEEIVEQFIFDLLKRASLEKISPLRWLSDPQGVNLPQFMRKFLDAIAISSPVFLACTSKLVAIAQEAAAADSFCNISSMLWLLIIGDVALLSCRHQPQRVAEQRQELDLFPLSEQKTQGETSFSSVHSLIACSQYPCFRSCALVEQDLASASRCHSPIFCEDLRPLGCIGNPKDPAHLKSLSPSILLALRRFRAKACLEDYGACLDPQTLFEAVLVVLATSCHAALLSSQRKENTVTPLRENADTEAYPQPPRQLALQLQPKRMGLERFCEVWKPYSEAYSSICMNMLVFTLIPSRKDRLHSRFDGAPPEPHQETASCTSDVENTDMEAAVDYLEMLVTFTSEDVTKLFELSHTVPNHLQRWKERILIVWWAISLSANPAVDHTLFFREYIDKCGISTVLWLFWSIRTALLNESSAMKSMPVVCAENLLQVIPLIQDTVSSAPANMAIHTPYVMQLIDDVKKAFSTFVASNCMFTSFDDDDNDDDDD